MTKQALIFLFSAILLAAMAACGSDAGQEAKDIREEAKDVRTEAAELADEARESAQELSDAAKEEIRKESAAMVQEIGKTQQAITQRILSLKEEIARAGEDTREKLQAEKNKLEEFRDNLNIRTQQVQQDARENWEELKSNVEKELKAATDYLEK